MGERFLFEFKTLNDAQREAATTLDGHLLINAVAGSGKTKTLACRTAYAIECGIPPQSILMFTFTNNAADVMRERVISMTDEGRKVNMMTCHSFCARQLRMFGEKIGIKRNFTILTQSDVRDCVKMLMDSPEVIPQSIKADEQFPKYREIASFISESMNKALPLPVVLMSHGMQMAKQFGEQICAIADAYEAYKRKTGVCDYDDLLVLYYKLLSEHKDILMRTADSFRYIMVDEYQDTNRIQEMILFALKDAGSSIAVVGDHAQSLYGFRGADMRNIIDFPKKVPECKVVNLTTNYRSSQEILNVGNFILSNSSVGEQLRMEGTFTTGELPYLVRDNSSFDSATTVANLVNGFRERGKAWGDIAVLSRNATSTKQLETIFTATGVPYVKYGGMKFLERAHIRDILAYIRIMVNSSDEIAWYRTLAGLQGVGGVTARKMSAECSVQGADALLLPKYMGKKFTAQLRRLYDVIRTDEVNPFVILKNVIDFYTELQKAIISAKPESKREELSDALRKNVKDFRVLQDVSAKYESLSQFAEDMTVNSEDKTDSDGAVVVSTIHSAKGLEWDTVIIMDCVEGVFPRISQDEIGTDKDEEELRCMYVAATRAKNHLYFFSPLYPQMSSGYGGMSMSAAPSHYLPYGDSTLMRRTRIH